MKKCINCVWQGEDTVGPLEHCPVCGDNTENVSVKDVPVKEDKPETEKNKNKYDLDGDGDVDNDDRTIAAKLLGSKKGKSSKPKKKAKAKRK